MATLEQKGKLLVVDDERMFLKLLTRYFQNHFDIKCAESGIEALEIIKSGFEPGVILSDQMMPYMSGTEFLAKTIELIPDAVRIIITAHSDPTEIIACINQAHAYMFLKKPIEELSLIQTIKLCFKHYNSKQRRNSMIASLNQAVEDLSEYYNKMSKVLISQQVFFSQLIDSLNGICEANERFYYKSNLKNVGSIARALAKEIDVTPDELKAVEILSVLQSAVQIGFPEKFLLYDPAELTEESELLAYYEYFQHFIDMILKVELLRKYGFMLVQIWEHENGSGFFNKLIGNDIFRCVQIVSIAKFYHNSVYRLLPDDLPKLKRNGEVIQTKAENRIRHNEAIKQLYKNVKKFDHDVFYTLQDLIKNRAIHELVPDENNLTVVYRESDFQIDFESLTKQYDGGATSSRGKDTLTITINKTNTADELKELEIPVDKLESGMLIGENVVTKSGLLVVRQDTKINGELAKQIKQLEKTGMLPGYVTILVPNTSD